MHLLQAQAIASHIVDELRPLCERIEIAGSIRRQRPECADIDLVILAPDPAAVKQRCRMRCAPVIDGLSNATFRMSSGVQLDLFFARPPVPDLIESKPCNWGSVLLCRTGSKEHNVFLCQRAHKLGLKWNPQEGVLDPEGYVIASETEQQIYEMLGLPFILPVHREITWLTTHFGPAPHPQKSAENRPVLQGPSLPPVKIRPDPEAVAKAVADLHAFGQSLKG